MGPCRTKVCKLSFSEIIVENYWCKTLASRVGGAAVKNLRAVETSKKQKIIVTNISVLHLFSNNVDLKNDNKIIENHYEFSG